MNRERYSPERSIGHCVKQRSCQNAGGTSTKPNDPAVQPSTEYSEIVSRHPTCCVYSVS